MFCHRPLEHWPAILLARVLDSGMRYAEIKSSSDCMLRRANVIDTGSMTTESFAGEMEPAKRLVVSGEREAGLEPATTCLESRNL